MAQNKQVIFNVGCALSVYTETDDKIILNDLGKSANFNPVTDFLEPLFDKRNCAKNNGKYTVDQLIISHPHKDHISAIQDFNKNFQANLLTCPNDKDGQSENEKIDWDLTGIDMSDESVKTLIKMWDGRNLPLQSSMGIGSSAQQYIYWIPPKVVGDTSELLSESYANNISLLTVYRINGHTTLLPGDLQKEGLKHILKNDYHDADGHGSASNGSLKNILLKHRVCILVAPHHGLRSAFSIELFDAMNKKKTRCLNIISEKKNNSDDNRDVDSRYSSADYCDGDNNLESGNGQTPNYQRKTSEGHICIDYRNGSVPQFTIIQDNDMLIEWFCN
ncbi:MAG: hypothetical protein LBI57_05170 [Helicobacteraceae bacterium]|jgi:competence protein ComEC|nr:hypothetical protein [Helicobacteraceae bacterium]